MRAQVTLPPGQKGTKKLQAQDGTQLICVRDHYDTARQRRLTTVAVLVEEAPWRPERAARTGAVQREVKLAGGKWHPARRVWAWRRDQVRKLGLHARIEDHQVSIRRNS